MNLSNLFLNVTIVLTLNTSLLSLFDSYPTLLVNQFLPLSLLNLNLSSLNPLLHVVSGSFYQQKLVNIPFIKALHQSVNLDHVSTQNFLVLVSPPMARFVTSESPSPHPLCSESNILISILD